MSDGEIAMQVGAERVGSPRPRDIFVPHGFEEKLADLGEISMNYAEAGSPDKPALLLLPEQMGSWWTYEAAMKLLAPDFHVFAVDMRGQGRSSWTPKRYSLDNFGNDLVRFIALVIKRPVIVAGCSSGGVLAAWLSAFSMPGQIRAAWCEDAPFFASELLPAHGHTIRQAAGPAFAMFSKFLGDQWSIGDWAGFLGAAKTTPILKLFPTTPEPPQNLREYDPEWSRAFFDGTVALHCPHDRMLAQVKTPLLLTHHMHTIDPASGDLFGALSDFQAEKVQQIVRANGGTIEYQSHPDAFHMMHLFDASRYAEIMTDWVASLALD